MGRDSSWVAACIQARHDNSRHSSQLLLSGNYRWDARTAGSWIAAKNCAEEATCEARRANSLYPASACECLDGLIAVVCSSGQWVVSGGSGLKRLKDCVDDRGSKFRP
jgi:hypothetical protein